MIQLGKCELDILGDQSFQEKNSSPEFFCRRHVRYLKGVFIPGRRFFFGVFKTLTDWGGEGS